MNVRLTTVFVMIMILFVTFNNPLPVATAAPNVDDWLKDNKNDSEDETENMENEDSITPSIDESDTEKSQPEEKSTSLLVVIVKMIFALFLVLGLIYVLLQFLKRKNKRFMKSNALENIGGITVGSNKSMQIIRIGSRFFVIGVGENVEILHEIIDQEVVQDLLEKDEGSDKPTNRLLSSIMSGKLAGQKKEQNFKQLFSRELQNLKQSRKKIMNEDKEDTHE